MRNQAAYISSKDRTRFHIFKFLETLKMPDGHRSKRPRNPLARKKKRNRNPSVIQMGLLFCGSHKSQFRINLGILDFVLEISSSPKITEYLRHKGYKQRTKGAIPHILK